MIKSFLRLQSDRGSKKHQPFPLDSTLGGDPKRWSNIRTERSIWLFCTSFAPSRHRGHLTSPRGNPSSSMKYRLAQKSTGTVMTDYSSRMDTI